MLVTPLEGTTYSDKTGVQCKAKMRLKLDYCKIKDNHGKTGRGCSTWKLFEALDAVLGQKPATKPPVVLDTSGHPAERNDSDHPSTVALVQLMLKTV